MSYVYYINQKIIDSIGKVMKMFIYINNSMQHPIIKLDKIVVNGNSVIYSDTVTFLTMCIILPSVRAWYIKIFTKKHNSVLTV